MPPITPWVVRAANLPEHGDNPVHTDDGARAAGHERALVAGTTVYAYLTHPVAAAWGVDWLTDGGGEVRFRSPVFDEDDVEVAAVDHEGRTRLEAHSRGALRATFDVWLGLATPGPMRGDEQPSLVVEIDDALAGYGRRAGDDLALYDDFGLAHPSLSAVLGNRAMMASVVDGPWIHVRSHISHQGIIRPGDVAVVDYSIADRFDSRAGERAILDLRVSVDDRPVLAVEHEAIIRLA